MSNYISVREMVLRKGLGLRQWVINVLLLRDRFRHLSDPVVPENELLADAAMSGLDPLEIIRSYHYNLNPKHYERSI